MQGSRHLIGTAGWAVSGSADAFPAEGTTLQRYASRFDAVEINSSFHRRHRPQTWQRWAESTADRFRFAVKLPKTITHQAKLVSCETLNAEFAEDVAGLGAKLAIVLVQLPPSLAFDPQVAAPFFAQLIAQVPGRVACEPRHWSWFEADADTMLATLGVARVAADPALSEVAGHPGGALDLAYWRLHGSPRIYRSAYGEARLAGYAPELAASQATERWCMFDNTASSAAIDDALALARMIG